MTAPDRLAPFRAADRFRFYSAGRPYQLSAGAYGQGVGALTVYGPEGPDFVLTTNVEPTGAPTLPVGHLYVKFSKIPRANNREPAHHPPALALAALGVFHRLGTTVSQNFIKHYAEEWMFAECRRHALLRPTFAVECPSCRAGWAATFEAERLCLLAKDAAKRLGAAS